MSTQCPVCPKADKPYGPLNASHEARWCRCAYERVDNACSTGRAPKRLLRSMMKALGYTWRVLVNLFYVALILYVFDKLNGRHEITVLVAVLGLIYVTIRSIALSQGHSFIEITKGLRGELLRIRELLHDEFVEHHKRELTEALEVVDRAMIKGYIDGFFLGIVSLICLFGLHPVPKTPS
jgi:hypothetical protein